jgi:ABC-type oligopeptide transport system substrate-binding subunit
MKIKVLLILSLAAFMFLAGCRSTDNANANAVNSNVTTVTNTNESAATDPNLKKKIEDALKAKGYNDLTIDTSTTPATLRGSYPKDKMADVMMTAQEAAGKPVKNEATAK